MLSREPNPQISQKLFEKLDYAYLCIDHSLIVQSVSQNLGKFGFAAIPTGSDVTDYIDFMVGMDTHSEIQLPVVNSPSGQPISVRLLPDEETVMVVIGDASNLFSQRQLLQQKANENELLLDQQHKLMRELEAAKRELEIRNEELREAARLQSSFLSGVSHEFRTPLTSIIGYTNLLNSRIDRHLSDGNDESARQSVTYLSAVRRSSKHLLSLVENLLDHGKLDSGEIIINPRLTDLAEVFEDVTVLLGPLSATKNVEFVVQYEPGNAGSVLIDDSRLRQCLINIISNAIKFTDIGSVTVNAAWRDELLTVAVIDTGLGISKEHLQKIRQPFWQVPDTGKAGTGLGLTITERIIELMGGALSISSEPGCGTKVKFTLAAPRFDDADQVAQPIPVAPTQALHILLAEDDDDIADLIVVLLEEASIQVTRVGNGALAVDAVNEGQFDLILMDIHMPVIDGYAATEMIRNNGFSTPIVIMSASSVESDRSKAEQLGCDGFLVKPVDVSDIIAIANQVI